MVANIVSYACSMLHLVSLSVLSAACTLPKWQGSVGRLSDSGSMDSVQNISQVSWLHLEF